jgi:hypothetical protein
MPRNDPREVTTQKPNIDFLITQYATREPRLYQALQRLNQQMESQDWIKTLFYLGELVVADNALTHLYVVDIPTDRKVTLVSLTLSVIVPAAAPIVIRVKKRLYEYSDTDAVANEKWESVCDQSNVFITEGRTTGQRVEFVAPDLFNGDQIQIDVLETGSASNIQMAIRGKYNDA